MAGWPDDRDVWTGSCPCQPFSAAGKRKGAADSRHLWPEFARLIAERRPARVFGEQVASKDGRLWLAGVRTDLEALGYAVGASDLCAAGVGAPHIRQRLYWMADSDSGRCEQRDSIQRSIPKPDANCADGRMVNADQPGSQGRGLRPDDNAGQFAAWASGFDVIDCADGKARRVESGTFPLAHGIPNRMGRLRGYGNGIVPQVAAEFIAAVMECRP